MTESDVKPREFKLDPDSELRFEIESKFEKVTLEVSFVTFFHFIFFG